MISLKKEQEKSQLTKIGNKSYDINEKNRIAVCLTQCRISQREIRKLLNVSKTLTSKWSKKKYRVPKISYEENEFIFTSSEGKMTILNKS